MKRLLMKLLGWEHNDKGYPRYTGAIWLEVIYKNNAVSRALMYMKNQSWQFELNRNIHVEYYRVAKTQVVYNKPEVENE